MKWSIRAAGAAAVAGATVLLSGCTAPLPEVSFYGNRSTVTTAPALWCAADAAAASVDCVVDTPDSAAVRLPVGTGQPISVNVPAGVGRAPWVVLFRYRDASGTVQELRGPLLASGIQQHYVVRPPSDADQLLRVEVQGGLTPVAPDSGTGVDYAAMHTWVLRIDPTG